MTTRFFQAEYQNTYTTITTENKTHKQSVDEVQVNLVRQTVFIRT